MTRCNTTAPQHENLTRRARFAMKNKVMHRFSFDMGSMVASQHDASEQQNVNQIK
jgi:hypothetical protein